MTIFEADPNLFERELQDFDHPPEEPTDGVPEVERTEGMVHIEHGLGKTALSPEENDQAIMEIVKREMQGRKVREIARVGEEAYFKREQAKQRAKDEVGKPGGLGTDFSPYTNRIESPRFDENGNQLPGKVIIKRAKTVVPSPKLK